MMNHRLLLQPIRQVFRLQNKANRSILLNTAPSKLAACRNKQTVSSFHRAGTASCICIREFNTEAEFHRRSDKTLENIQECIEDSIEDIEEVVVASGVLTMETPRGTWVINKQTPVSGECSIVRATRILSLKFSFPHFSDRFFSSQNRQLWWSSPISGPRRYEYDEEARVWVYTRDGGNLKDILEEEILAVFGKQIVFQDE